jgi:hypothetical protein
MAGVLTRNVPPGPPGLFPARAAERDAAHRAFRRVSIDVPALEVDTSDGYRPPFGQILSFVTGTMES